jgi:hypothetical protein
MILVNANKLDNRTDLTRCMLQVGPRTTDAALNLASGASNLSAMFSISSGSNVAPKAVADCDDNKEEEISLKTTERTGRHLAGVPIKK